MMSFFLYPANVRYICFHWKLEFAEEEAELAGANSIVMGRTPRNLTQLLRWAGLWILVVNWWVVGGYATLWACWRDWSHTSNNTTLSWTNYNVVFTFCLTKGMVPIIWPWYIVMISISSVFSQPPLFQVGVFSLKFLASLQYKPHLLKRFKQNACNLHSGAL